jgi:hypothetical protein
MLRADGQGAPGDSDVRRQAEALRALLRQAWERGLRPDEEQAVADLREVLRRLLAEDPARGD